MDVQWARGTGPPPGTHKTAQKPFWHLVVPGSARVVCPQGLSTHPALMLGKVEEGMEGGGAATGSGLYMPRGGASKQVTALVA